MGIGCDLTSGSFEISQSVEDSIAASGRSNPEAFDETGSTMSYH